MAPALVLGALFLASAVLGYFTLPATARMFQMGETVGTAYAYFSVALVGFPGGLLFPRCATSASARAARWACPCPASTSSTSWAASSARCSPPSC